MSGSARVMHRARGGADDDWDGVGEVVDLASLLREYQEEGPEGQDFEAAYAYEARLLQGLGDEGGPMADAETGQIVNPAGLLEPSPQELQRHLNAQGENPVLGPTDGKAVQQQEHIENSSLGKPEETNSFMAGLGASQIQYGRSGSNQELGDGHYPSGHLVSDVDELHRLGIHPENQQEQTGYHDPAETQGEGVFSFGEASRFADAGSAFSSKNYAPEVQAILEENRRGLELLKMGNYKECLQILKMCEGNLIRRMKEEQAHQKSPHGESQISATQPDTNPVSMMLRLLAITLNNLACYCKKRNLFQMGLRYLARVLQIEKYSARGKSNGSALAATYLNIGAVLSSMNKSKESIKMASKATNILLNLKEERLLNGQDLTSGEKVNLVVGHYNLAVGAELGGHRSLAIEKASQGYQFAMMELGLAHPLTEDVGAYLQKLRSKAPQANQNTSRIQESQNRSNYMFEGRGSGDISQALNRPIAPPTTSNLGKSDNLLRGNSSRYENSGYSREYSSKPGGRLTSQYDSGSSNAKQRFESTEGLSRRAKAGTLQLDDAGQLNLVIRNNQVNVISTGLGFLEGLGDRPLKKVPKKKKQMLRPIQRPNPSDPYKLKLANPLGSKSRSQSSQNHPAKRTPHETASARETQLRSLLDDMLNTKMRGNSDRIYREGPSSNNQSSYSRSKSLINRGEDSILDPNSLIQNPRRDSVSQHHSNLKLKIWTNKEKPIELDNSGYDRTFGSSTPFKPNQSEQAARLAGMPPNKNNGSAAADDRLPSLRESQRSTLHNPNASRRESRHHSEQQNERERVVLPRPNIPRPPRASSRQTSEDARSVHEPSSNHKPEHSLNHQEKKEPDEHVARMERELSELRQKVRMYEDLDRPKFMVTSSEKIQNKPAPEIRKPSPPKEKPAVASVQPVVAIDKKVEHLPPQSKLNNLENKVTQIPSENKQNQNLLGAKLTELPQKPKLAKDAQGRVLPVLESSQKELIRQMLSKEVEDGDIEILHPLHSEELSKSDETRRSKYANHDQPIMAESKPAKPPSRLAQFTNQVKSRILEDPHEDSETVTPVNRDDWIYVQEKSTLKVEPSLDNNNEIKRTNDTRFAREQPAASLSQTHSVLGTNPLLRTSMLSQYGLNTTLSGGFGMKKVVAYNLKYKDSSDSENLDSRS